jgi:hypothetical protein
MTDARRMMIADAVAEILKNDETLSEKYFLLSCQETSAVNHTMTARVFNEAIQTLWPRGLKSDAMSPVTNTAPYMKEAAK